MKNQSTIWKYYLFSFLKDFAFFSAVLVPFFTQWGHISMTQVQLLQSWFMLCVFILEIPTGAIADYFGRKHSLCLGAIVIASGALLYGSIPNFGIFLLAEAMYAVGVALISGADSALLFDSLKEQGRENESNKIFGKAHSFTLLGILIAAPIGGLIATKFGLNYPILFSSIPFFCAAIVAFTLKEPKFYQDVSESTRYLDVIKTGFSYFRHHKILRMLALDAIVVSSAAYFVIWLYQPIFMSLKMPIIYFGLFHALLVASEIFIASNFSFLEKLFGSSEKYLNFSAIITGVSFLVTAIFPNIITGILFIIIAGGFGLTRFELMTSHMNQFIPSSKRATIISSISMFRRFALVLLNPFIGFTIDHSLRLALLLVGLLPFTIFLFPKVKIEKNVM